MKTLQEIEKEFKECLTCKTWKRFVEFNIDRAASSGLKTNCKDCERAKQNSKYKEIQEDPVIYSKELERRRIAQSKIRSNPNHSNIGLEYSKRDLIKTSARSALNAQIRSGNITKLPCQICGDKESQGHHEDYSKPLDVIWLCKIHHAEIHRKFNTIKQQLGLK